MDFSWFPLLYSPQGSPEYWGSYLTARLLGEKVGERLLVLGWCHPCFGSHCWCLSSHQPPSSRPVHRAHPLRPPGPLSGTPYLFWSHGRVWVPSPSTPGAAGDLRNWPHVLKTPMVISRTPVLHHTWAHRLHLCFSDSAPAPQPKEIFSKTKRGKESYRKLIQHSSQVFCLANINFGSHTPMPKLLSLIFLPLPVALIKLTKLCLKSLYFIAPFLKPRKGS